MVHYYFYKKNKLDLRINDVFLANAQGKSLLYLDDWRGWDQVSNASYEDLQISRIPPGLTAVSQPLDCGFNRYFKSYYRALTEKIRRQFPDFIVSQRKNIGLNINETIYQLKADRFKNLIIHAWKKAGFPIDIEEEFPTPVNFCFDFHIMLLCIVCNERAFIRCSHCGSGICFEHYRNKHRCD
jgi:hypothetical protein